MVRRKKKTLFNVFNWVALYLIIVGALNWGLVGFFGFDLVQWLSMGNQTLVRTVYSVVGVGGAYLLFGSILWMRR